MIKLKNSMLKNNIRYNISLLQIQIKTEPYNADMIKLDFAYKGNSVVIFILVKCVQNLLLMVIVHNQFVAKDIQNTAKISCKKSVFGAKIVNIFIKNKLLLQQQQMKIAINYMTLNDEKYEEVLQNDLDEKNN